MLVAVPVKITSGTRVPAVRTPARTLASRNPSSLRTVEVDVLKRDLPWDIGTRVPELPWKESSLWTVSRFCGGSHEGVWAR